MQLKLTEITTYVDDLAAAVAFYRDMIGLSLREQTSEYAIFDASGLEFVLMGGGRPVPIAYATDCGTLACFETGNIEATIRNMVEKDVAIRHDIKTVPQGKFAVIEDPSGNMIEIIQRQRAA